MKSNGVITDITEFVNPIVIVSKSVVLEYVYIDPNYNNLNELILREYYVILMMFEVIAILKKNAKMFCTLDANKGFWQTEMSENSSKITDLCYTTPFGRYPFLRLTFCLFSPSEISRRCFSGVFNIKGVFV